MTSKRIVFCTFGSLGDIFPYLSIARELQARGHHPLIATTRCYRTLIESHGIPFHPIRPNIDVTDPSILRRVMDRRTGGRYIICDLLFPALRDSYEDTVSASARADLLVTHPVTLSAFLYARKTAIPWVSTALAPMSIYSVYDPPVLPGIPFAEKLATFGPAVQRRLLTALAFLFEPQWKPFRKFEKELGLPPAPNPLLQGHSPQMILGLFSPMLGKPQSDWPPHAHATGFPFFPQRDELSPELQRFLDSGAPPLVFTLGTAAVGAAGDFFQSSAEAAYCLGLRAILLKGRDPNYWPVKDLPPGVIAVPYAPHSALFPRATAVVHQGGIGTTAEAMRAGRPMLVVPYSHDQPDHAARLARLGVARTISRERYNSRIAVREIDILLRAPAYTRRAAEVSLVIGSEYGAAHACDLLLNMLKEPRTPDRAHGELTVVAGSPHGKDA
jgi:rhamnosyltransferase subunit B